VGEPPTAGGDHLLAAENHVLREQLGGKTLRFTDAQRSRLARVAHSIGRRRLREIGTIVTSDTLLRWYRELVARKYDGSKKRGPGPGRLRIAGEIRGLILEIARGNPGWGYTRIRGALENLGYAVGRNTIKRTLLENGFDPAGFRGTTWSTFLRAHWGARRNGPLHGSGGHLERAGPLLRDLRHRSEDPPGMGLFLHHTDTDREYPYDCDSPVGMPDKMLDMAGGEGWIVVDMKRDWKVVFPLEKH